MEASDFFVEDLLDLTNGAGDDVMTDAFFTGNSTDSSTAVTPVDSCNSSLSGGAADFPPSFPPDAHFSGELCVPYDDLAELEWLSNFVEESFSSEDLHKFHLIPVPGQNQQHSGPNSAQAQSQARFTNPNQPSSVPGKARSKRSRVAPCDWSTRLLMVSSPTSPAMSSSSDQTPTTHQKKPSKRRDNSSAADNNSGGGEVVRRCLHCAAEKTPQWRTGPMGPKTLCNACGVRYKSGRLVPEYRPAASPTFISTKHSNSHRKVMELRRQKEVQVQQPHHHHPEQQQQQQQQQHNQFMGHHHHHHHHQHHQRMMINGGGGGSDDYLIHHHHHLAPDHYRQMI